MAWYTTKIINYTFLYLCTIIEFSSLCYLFYALSRRNSPIRQAYFIISILGYIIDFTTKLSAIITYEGKFKSVILWHDVFLFGIITFVLSLNRYTAIAYWKDHSRFWSFWPTCAWCVFLLAYPVIVDIGFLASDPNGFFCLPNHPFRVANENCPNVYIRIGFRQCASSVITMIGSLILNALTIMKIRKTSAPQIATKLFIQSCVSNAIFTVFVITLVFNCLMWIHADTADQMLKQVNNMICNLSNYIRQSVNMIWLVVITRSVIRTSKHIVVSTTVTSSTTK
uniref:G_PROTEIN_RECEP_F1_2 domain-containing protein n=1 Tax=Panagrellus redivivus TaxID=6233 RepID=A0A7E4ZRN5_PANRE